MMTSRSTTALCLLSLLSISFSGLASAPATQPTLSITYKEIGDPLIAAIGFVDKEKKELTEKEKLEVLKEIPQLSAGEMLKLAFEILEANGQPNTISPMIPAASYRAMKTTAKELELFFNQGSNSKNHLFSKINHTSTIMGQAALAKMLMEPIDDLQQLHNRQAFIQEIVNNKQLYTELDSLLGSLSQKESDLLSFWQKTTPVSEQAAQALYIPFVKSLNSNPTAVSTYRALINGGLCATTVISAAFSAILTVNAIKLSNYTQEISWPLVGNAAYFGAGSAMYSAIIFLKLKSDYIVLRYMQTRLSGMATLLTTAEKLHNIASNNDVVTRGLFAQHMGIEHLEQQKQKLAQLKTLVGYLETATFAGDYSFFSNSGRILAAFNLIQDLKNEFVGLMQAVGEVDACLSIAKLYKSLQENSNATYCFVDYVEQDTPYLHLENFWNPIIDPSVVVTNSIELGGANSPRNIVVTGSNTGGKSTILKAVVANIMLSRLGIAPARVAVMTPFTYLATSMNIGDDTAGGVSLFKAEVLRAKSILNNVKSLQPNQFAFLAIDELFVGTASEKGEEAACKFAETLNALPNTMFTFATHFKKATTLEQRTNGTCKNYMVEAYKDGNGTIVRPFKLEAGISTSNIANDILQENISSIDFLESSVDILA